MLELRCKHQGLFVNRPKSPAPTRQQSSEPRSVAPPAVPAEWKPCVGQLIKASRTFDFGPPWWSPQLGFFGTLEARPAGNNYRWDGLERFAKGDPPFFLCQLTLAGLGHFEPHGEPPQQMTPGSAFFVTIPSRHHYYLPASSPGWTFCWVAIYHPYVIERAKKRIALSGPTLQIKPVSGFVASVTRLVRGTFRKDFRDRLEVELALFEFVLAYERLALHSGDPAGESERLLDDVGRRVLADAKRPVKVGALAAEYGMSRSHFSHFFRTRTALTPARFIAETRIREAARLLVETRLPLKQIADACGFANVNHFSKMFRRFHHRSPGSFRRWEGRVP